MYLVSSFWFHFLCSNREYGWSKVPVSRIRLLDLWASSHTHWSALFVPTFNQTTIYMFVPVIYSDSSTSWLMFWFGSSDGWPLYTIWCDWVARSFAIRRRFFVAWNCSNVVNLAYGEWVGSLYRTWHVARLWSGSAIYWTFSFCQKSLNSGVLQTLRYGATVWKVWFGCWRCIGGCISGCCFEKWYVGSWNLCWAHWQQKNFIEQMGYFSPGFVDEIGPGKTGVGRGSWLIGWMCFSHQCTV